MNSYARLGLVFLIVGGVAVLTTRYVTAKVGS